MIIAVVSLDVEPFHSQDHSPNSPYSLFYNSYGIGLKNFVLDQLIIP